MEQTIFTGPNMAVVGISTVFVALTIIVTVVSIVARVLARNEGASVSPEAASAFAAAAEASTAQQSHVSRGSNDSADSDGNELLRRVAMAAYAYHLGRRVSVRANVAPSPWLRAGRQAQVNRTQSRG